MNDTDEIVEIYIQLLGDEEGTLRPTTAISLGNNLYKLLPIDGYEDADESWEFIPETIVIAEIRTFRGKDFLYATKEAN